MKNSNLIPLKKIEEITGKKETRNLVYFYLDFKFKIHRLGDNKDGKAMYRLTPLNFDKKLLKAYVQKNTTLKEACTLQLANVKEDLLEIFNAIVEVKMKKELARQAYEKALKEGTLPVKEEKVEVKKPKKDFKPNNFTKGYKGKRDSKDSRSFDKDKRDNKNSSYGKSKSFDKDSKDSRSFDKDKRDNKNSSYGKSKSFNKDSKDSRSFDKDKRDNKNSSYGKSKSFNKDFRNKKDSDKQETSYPKGFLRDSEPSEERSFTRKPSNSKNYRGKSSNFSNKKSYSRPKNK